ncbi:hypothetical protein F5Y04DRAFT_291533 [Hypomontagnella monticulosa]|nr:hypothetical protein F5Y04DRAFT_291533 [Hypomontagnella monticulosa]
MTSWISCHGAGAIPDLDQSFTVKAGGEGLTISPTEIGKLSGSVIFPLSGLPQNSTHFVKIEVNFTAQNASVDGIKVWANDRDLFQRANLRKISNFTIDVRDPFGRLENPVKGLALVVEVKFAYITSQLAIQMAGLEVAIAPPIPIQRLESGTWSTMDVRPWNQRQDQTQDRIEFPTEFKSLPMVMVNLTSVDISSGSNCRVKVYATEVNSRGFTVHADTWGGTILYSCGVSWVALGT